MIHGYQTNENDLNDGQLSNAFKLSKGLLLVKSLFFLIGSTIILLSGISYINNFIIQNIYLNWFLIIYILLRIIYGVKEILNKLGEQKNKMEGIINGRKQTKRKTI